jgi:hypothetical protein
MMAGKETGVMTVEISMSLLVPLLAGLLAAAPPAVIVREADVMRAEVPPHGGVGMSTAWRLSDAAPGRNFEFRKRAMEPGSSIGLHVLGHDEVYYVVSGTGVVTSDGREYAVEAGRRPTSMKAPMSASARRGRSRWC